MSVDTSLPGVALLGEITKHDPKAVWLAEQLEELDNRCRAMNVSPEVWMAMMAAHLGFALGNGARVGGQGWKALEQAILVAESIMEDAATNSLRG